MKKSWIKIITFISIIASLMLVLAGCGNNSSAQ